MQPPMTAIASDGRLVQPGEGHPHPRWYGTFPRVLGEYVRDRGVLTLEEAVRKMTKLAKRLLKEEFPPAECEVLAGGTAAAVLRKALPGGP